MKIDELLNKYFEGETSCEEERRLRRFFTEEEVPEHLQTYRPLFAYLEKEVGKKTPTLHRKSIDRHRLFRLWSGIAAGLLLLFGLSELLFPVSAESGENYVIIDGTRYTDENLAKAKALEALQMASLTQEELNRLILPDINMDK